MPLKLGKVLGLVKNLWEWYSSHEFLWQRQAQPSVDIVLLEDRIFYSASPFAMLAPDGNVGPDIMSVENVEALLQAAMATEVSGAGLTNTAMSDDELRSFRLADSVSPSELEAPRREIAFVDAGLEEVESLLAELQASQHPGVEWTVVYLESTQDGIRRIGEFLAGSQVDFDSVHLVTHGNANGLQLGSVWLDASTWSERREALQVWQQGLSEDADLLIYGCSVASTSAGQAWLEEMANGLGVDLAASVDLTGHASLLGNWELEFQVGEISTEVFASTSIQQTWVEVLATFTVTSTNDSGAGTLRQAINDANSNVGSDTIQFSVGSGVISINLSTVLPNITGTIVIDGWTQSGYTSTPIVVIDGGGLTGDGLVLSSAADNSTIRGLIIRNFNGDGIQIDAGSDGSTIAGNYIGSYGTSGGNLGSGESNTGHGINILGANNIIGGTSASLRNVIGGNASHGILMTGSSAFGNIILGNYIGTDATGNTAMANSQDGVHIANSAVTNTIGGTSTSARNVISGNIGDGIQIDGTTADDNTIRNNYIGLGANGTTAIGNGGSGILISGGANDTVIGGVNMGNVILGNRLAGIEIDGATTNTIIQGNYIGINIAGTLVQGNGQSGILLENGADNSLIGGINNGEGNVITANGTISSTSTAGIQILGGSDGNSIIGNSIYGNRGLGIDLGTMGVTPNDTGDGDTGPNNTQNFPVVTAASVNAAGTTVTVSGSLDSTANITGMLLHFYATPSSGNVNAREGRRYLGSTTVNTGAGGNATFSNLALSGFTGTVAAGELITATATTPGSNGNTSEFSVGMVASSSAGNIVPTTSQLISATDQGITINNTGYSSYFEAEDGGAILGGRTQLSMEFQFRGNPLTSDGGYGLVSYVTPTNGDALFIGVTKSGATERLFLIINGSTVAFDTDIDAIFDGNEHSLTATWQQTNGAYAIYVDGTLLTSGTGLATGHTISSGGQLAFGVDLDHGSNTWQRNFLFQGTFNDIRIFSDVRTAAEVAASFRSELPFNEGNLVANWRLDDLSTEMQTTNTVSGNDLVLRQLTQPGFSASTPALALRIDENTVTGTVVGTVAGIDVERDARITALLAADSSLRYSAETGKFYRLLTGTQSSFSAAQAAATSTTLSGLSGQLVTIRSAGENQLILQHLNTAGQYIWLGASDQTVEGEWRWQTGVSDADVFWNGTATGYTVGNYSNFNPGEPQASAANEDFLLMDSNTGRWNDTSAFASRVIVEWNADDVLDATNALTFSITTQTVTGAFAINSDTGVITVANGSLLNFEAQTSHTITVRTTDGSGASFDKNYTISLNNLNDAPVLTNGSTLAFTENQAATAINTAITVADVDSSTLASATVQITAGYQSGVDVLAFTNVGMGNIAGLWDSGTGTLTLTSAGATATVSQWQAALRAVTFANSFDAPSTTARTVSYTVNDGALPSNAVISTVNLSAVNDAPAFVGSDGIVTTDLGYSEEVARGVVIQSDGKIVAGGNADGGFALVRYNTDGSVDASFSGDGMLSHAILGYGSHARSLALQADGKIVAAGFAIVGSRGEFAMARFNSDGTLDTSFSGDGMLTLAVGTGDGTANSIALQADGKILVAGYARNGTHDDTVLMRLNSDGTLDTSFGVAGIRITAVAAGNDQGYGVSLQPDGKILVAGDARIGGVNDFAVVRYDSNGNLDTTFGSGGIVITQLNVGVDIAYSVAVQADGKILVGGHSVAGGNSNFAVVRYNSNGTLDTGFGVGGIRTVDIGGNDDVAYSLTLQADGKILLAGRATLPGGSTEAVLARLNSDGTLDTTFSGDGIVNTNVGGGIDAARSVAVQADGKIVVAGSTGSDFAVVRYNSDGTVDTGFDTSTAPSRTVGYIENGAAVVLYPTLRVLDAELSAAGNYSGATLTLVRNGGANAQDVYSATGTLGSISATSGNVVVGGTTIGTYTNSAGTLVLSFNASATQARVNEAMQQIAYANTSDAPPASVQINWTFNDGNTGSQGTGGALTATGAVVVNIAAVNDAPVLDNTGTMTFTSITENETASAGQTVASLISSAGGDRITDGDVSALEGIAVTALNSGNGTWQYSINGGTNWTAVGLVSDSSALLLRSTDLLRFVPNEQNATTGEVTFRAWDQSGATANGQGTKVDVSTNGGTTAFSSATEVASISVTAVNDAPTITNAYTQNLTGTNENTTSSGTLASAILAGAAWADVDTGALSGLAITSVAGNGAWQYSTDGTTWTNFGGVSANNALLITSTSQVRYIPDGNNGETANFTFKAWDQTSGTSSTNGSPVYASVATSGGTTAFSANNATAQIVVTGVNDAPEIAINAEQSVAITGGATFSSGFGGGVHNRTFDLAADAVVGTASLTINFTTIDNSFNLQINGQSITTGNTIQLHGGSLSAGQVMLSFAGSEMVTPWFSNPNGPRVIATISDSGITFMGLRNTTSSTYEVMTISGGGLQLPTFQLGTNTLSITNPDESGGDQISGSIAVTFHSSNAHTTTFTENGAAVSIATSDSFIIDVDDTNMESATVTLTNPQTGDRLLVNGSSSASGTLVSGISWTRSDNVVTLSGSFTRAQYAAALQLVQFESTSEAPSTTSRIVQTLVNDGTDNSNIVTTSITVTAVNDAPVAVVDTVTAVEAGGIGNAITGTNPSGNVLSNDTDVDAGETKTVTGVVAGVVGSASTNVGSSVTGTFGSINIAADGTYTYTVDNNNLTVQALAVGQSIDDVFTYTMRDTAGLTSTTQITVTIQGANDAPVEASIEGTALSYTENAGAVAISSTIAVTDVDDTNIESAIVTITGNYANGQDVLGFTSQNGITGTWNATTGELTLTGSATLAQYQVALRSITYTNSSEAPSTLTRTISFTINDGSANSNTQTRVITVTATNDAPAFSGRDGTVFTGAATRNEYARSVVTQADGKILVAGWGPTASSPSNVDFILARYNSDGALDTSFGSGGLVFTNFGAGSSDQAYDIALQADGKILLAGASGVGGTNDFALVRYNNDGTLDTSFSGDGMVTTAIGLGSDVGRSVTVQADGKILVAGHSHNGSNDDFALVRYNSDGTLDTSFSGDGMLTTAVGTGLDQASSVIVQADGKILVAGTGDNNPAVVRYNSDGSLDTTFSDDGMVTTNFSFGNTGHSVVVQADGKVLLGGSANILGTPSFVVVRYNSDGTLDTSFSGDGRADFSVGSGAVGYSMMLQADGKLLVAGSASVPGNGNDFALVRVNSDGTLDTTFSGDGRVTTAIQSASDVAFGLAVQADGKIVLVGASNSGTSDDFGLVRYNSDGTLDTSLDPSNSLGGTVTYIEDGTPVVLDSDVKVFDAELRAADNFSGATLTLVRNGGANAQDLYSATGTLSALTEGGNLVVGGTTIGTVTTNSAGTLVLTFNASATQDHVNTAMQRIAYANSSDAPPASVQINWTFNDGNTGSQGSGGALAATGNVMVNISPRNDAPVLADTALSMTVAEDAGAPVGAVGTLVSALTGGITDADAGGFRGIAITATVETNGVWYFSINNGAAWTAVGAVSDTSALLLRGDGTARLYFAPTANYNGTSAGALTFRAWDATSGIQGNRVTTASNGGQTAFSTATDVIDVTVTAVNDAPIAVVDTATAVEAGGTANGTAGTNPTGNVLTNDTDVDAGDTRTVIGVLAGVQASAAGSVATPVSGSFGSITIAADGSYTYNVDNANAAVQALRSSANTLQDVFTYTMRDTAGLTSTTQITVTIQGANDAPNQTSIEGTALGYTENAGAVAITSTLTLADVDDANLSSATIQITANYVTGQDELSFIDQNGITGSWNSTNGTLTLTGSASIAHYQAALRSITYANSSEAPSTATRTVSFTVNDGVLASNLATRDIAMTAVNDAPVNNLPGVQTTGVNTSVTLAGANAMQISDVDAGNSTVRITLTAANGTMTLGSTAGLSFTTGDGTADGTMVIQGTVAAINAALDGLSFTPANNFNGTATIELQTEDLGNTGTGGNRSDTDILSIQVGGLRFQEGVNGYSGTQDTYVTSNPGNVAFGSGSTVLVDDPSSHGLIRFDNLFGNGAGQIATGSTITNATLSLYVSAVDALDWINVHRMLSSWSEASTWNGMSSGVQANNVEASTTILSSFSSGQAGWITITGITSTVQDWANGAANHGLVLFGSNADNWAFYSSEYATASLRPYLSVTFTAPQSADIDLDSNNSSGATGSSFQRTWTENGGAVTIADLDATITDADSSQLQSMTVTITNPLDGALETLAANTAGTSITASYNSGTGQLTLSGVDSVANYQTVLRTVTYNNSSESPNTASRLITIQAADAYVSSNLATATVAVVALNDAPVLDNTGVMTFTTITEDQTSNTGNSVSSIIASAGGDRITDADSGAVEGIAITSTANGNGYWEYSTNGGTNWTDVGTVANNSALLLRSSDFIRFVPNAQVATTANITFRAWDQTTGGFGTKVDVSTNGGTTPFSSATETASITVTEVNDEQVVATNTGATIAENSTGNVLSSAMLTTTDVDHTASQLSYTVTSATSNGTLRRNGVALTVSSTFTQADINSGLITYDHNGSETSSDAFSFSVDDGLGTASTGTFNLTITPVNDQNPIINSNGGGATANINVAENTTAVTTVVATDADLPSQTLAYSISGGADSTFFTIDANTGVLSFLSARNREANADVDSNGIYEVIIQASDGTLIDTQTLSITITDVDEFDVGAVTDADATTNSVSENASAGTVVGITASASDADATTNTITYTLINNDGGRFAIHSSTGVVTVLGAIDREADGPSRTIIVRATSADGSHTDQSFNISIEDVDEFDISSISDSNVGANVVDEFAANGTVVALTALATDSDATNNAVAYTLDNSAGGRFAIHATTGVVSVANGSLLDAAQATSHEIVVRAASADGSFSARTFTINISNLNDAPTAVADSAIAVEAGGVSNAVSGTNPSGNVLSNDTDPDVGDSHTVSGVVAGTSANAVGSVGSGVLGLYGVITINADGSYSYVVDNSHAAVQALRTSTNTLQDVFTYTMVDSGGLTSSTQITVTIQGQNDNPIAVSDSTIAVEAGGISNGTSGTNPTGNVLANDTDVDAGDSKTVIGISSGVHASTSGSVGSTILGSYGQITLAANGSYSYLVDNNSAAVQALRNSSETLQDIFSYTMQDSAGVTTTTQITITIEGRNDAPTDLGSGALAVDENASHGTSIGSLAPTDIDTTDSFTYSLTNDANGRFAIHATTGEITVANGTLLNRELAASHTIIARVTDTGGLYFEKSFTIAVNDVDEFNVGSILDGTSDPNAVNENVAIGTLVGIAASAIDADATNNTITYSLIDNDGGNFAIDANTGIVTTAAAINREALGASRSITVRATSTDGSFTDQAFSIAINDLDEFDTGVVTDSNPAVNAVNENVAIGTVVGIAASAIDADATNSTITYSLVDNDGGNFAIDANTGIVTTAAAINRETLGASRSITIRATSTDGSFTDQAFSIAINDLDEFDTGAVIDSNPAINAINENAAIGTVVGITANAIDADASNSTVTYSLIDNDGGNFAIDTNTGIVSTAATINREALGASRSITVRATSTDGSFTDQTFSIAINDLDEFSTTPLVDLDPSANSLNENVPIGTVVGITAHAMDSDATNNTVTYSLLDNDGGNFAIDANTGVVTTAALLDRETLGAARLITVRASSSDGSSTDLTFSISIQDIDEFDVSSLSDTDATSNSVMENSAAGTATGIQVFANDADATNQVVSYTLLDDAGGRFAIDAQTGLIRVADSTRLNYEANSSHTILVQAISNDGSVSQANFTIQVLDQQERPSAGNDNYATTYIEDLVIPAAGLLANDNDPDGGTLTAVLVSGPSTGSLTLNSDGSFLYEPAIGIDGVITFVYRVFDGVTYSDPATVQIVVAIPAVQAPESPSTTTNNSSSSNSSSTDLNTSSNTSSSEPSSSPSAEPEGTAIGALASDSQSAASEATAPASNSSSQQLTIAYAPTSTDTLHANLIATTALESSSYTLDGTHWYQLDQTHEGRRELESQRRYLESTANTSQFNNDRARDQVQENLKVFGDFDQMVFQTVIGTGAVIWIAQGIQILATLLSVTPAWLHVDPLNIVAGKLDEEEADGERTDGEKLFDR